MKEPDPTTTMTSVDDTMEHDDAGTGDRATAALGIQPARSDRIREGAVRLGLPVRAGGGHGDRRVAHALCRGAGVHGRGREHGV